MASPAVAAFNTSTEATDVTSHDVSLPASISAGDLLIGFLATDGGSNALTWTGWTQVFQNNNGACQLACYYRVADGGEGGTVVVTSATSQQSAHVTYRITGFDSALAPEVSGVANGTSAGPNPGGLTPAGGSKDYLFIEAAAIDGGVAITTASTNYGTLHAATSTGIGGVGLGTAQRALTTGSSENPDAMTAASSEDWHARIIAISPGVGGGGGGSTRVSRLAMLGVG